MGQNISKSISPPPLTLQHCLVDGELDLARYVYFKRRSDELDSSFTDKMFSYNSKKRRYYDIDDEDCSKKSNESHRSVKKHKLLVRNHDGNLRELKPEDTLWYLLYVSNPPMNERMHKLFRNRFRVPYSMFLDIANDINNHELFSRWQNTDATGDSPSNIKLLLLGSLRYIGRSWTFDDVHEANGISREVNRVFL